MLASGLVMLLLGRAILGSRTLPEIALIAGWGVLSLVLTVWGVLTPHSMRIPAGRLCCARRRWARSCRAGGFSGPELVGIGRLLVLGLPLLARLCGGLAHRAGHLHQPIAQRAILYDYGQFPARGATADARRLAGFSL